MEKKGHSFNFEGGEILVKMGASWFVSYSYYMYCDKKHKSWENNSTVKTRLHYYNQGKAYHYQWLQYAVSMNEGKLNRNSLGLSGSEVLEMAKKVLQKFDNHS
ncbi:MAG: hypothetical protein MJZ23_06240 [Paludibacteraceae bacterium]|nr:hypothetical protein [Paludibacteraceae bacterium]